MFIKEAMKVVGASSYRLICVLDLVSQLLDVFHNNSTERL